MHTHSTAPTTPPMTIPAIAPELSPDDDVETTTNDDEDKDVTDNGDEDNEVDKGTIREDVAVDDTGAEGAVPVELLEGLARVTTTASMTNA